MIRFVRSLAFALVALIALPSFADDPDPKSLTTSPTVASPVFAEPLPDVAPEGDALRVQLAASRVREAATILALAQRDLEDARAALRASAKITDADKVSAIPPYKIMRAEKPKAEPSSPPSVVKKKLSKLTGPPNFCEASSPGNCFDENGELIGEDVHSPDHWRNKLARSAAAVIR